MNLDNSTIRHMTTLVTGGTGFLGSHLVRKLLDRGDREVRVLTRSYDRRLSEKGVEVVEGDLTEDDLSAAVEGVDRIYHLAGKVTRDRDRAHELHDLHVEGTRRLLEAVEPDEVEKIVVASTSGTSGVSEDPGDVADESSPPAETLIKDWPYYLSKLYEERLCERYREAEGLPIVIVKPSLLLGPGDERGSSTRDVRLFLEGKVPAAPSGGIAFVDARDAAEAFLRAMDRAAPGEAFMINQVNLALEDYFEKLAAIANRSAPVRSLPDAIVTAGAKALDGLSDRVGVDGGIDPVSVEMARHYWYVDASKAREELDWQPRDPNETLRDTVEWLEQRHPHLG
ncbi:MAG: NAD-dependent epimerase/dehydratase family protein, partial [Bradymonadaceae bacterium]